MPEPLAYLLTWTCHGQHLHGDARGSVDCEHNVPGTPFIAADPRRRGRARALMWAEAISLTPAMRRVAREGIVRLCQERCWPLLACNVRTTHVHVVVRCESRSPEHALAQLKASATRELRVHGLLPPDARAWTRHGSTRWINHEVGLAAAMAYVEACQEGPRREQLERQRRVHREQAEALKAWLASRR